MNLLVISQVYPYPLHDGGRVDVYYRLKALNELGIKVWLVPFYNPAFAFPDVQALESLTENIFPVPYLRRKLSKVFHWRPYSIASKENFSLLNDIEKKLQGISFDAVVAESHHTLTIAKRFQKSLKIPKLILRSHNNEPAFMRSLAKTSPFFSIERLFFSFEAIKYHYYEKTLLRKLTLEDAIWHISLDEMKRTEKQFPAINQAFVPAAIDLKKMRPYLPKQNKIALFVGALFSPNNLQGLKWYLSHIHPHLVEHFKDYQLVVAGNSKGANPKALLALFNGLEAFQFFDTPKDLEPLYEMASVFINPMQHGAGVKLKTIEAALKAVPIVTSPCGNEGTGFENGTHVLVGTTSQEFRSHMISLLENEPQRHSLADQAQNYLNKHYHQSHAIKTLMN